MENKRVLIISIGTGTRNDGQSLARAIRLSIDRSGTGMVYLITSPESKRAILPYVLENAEFPYKVIELTDVDDINNIYRELAPVFQSLGHDCHVTVDYTSGTKSMTGALCLLASVFEVENMSYISGQRVNGVVASGAEKIINIRPYEIIADKKLREAVKFFNHCRYDAAETVILPLTEIQLPEIQKKVALVLNAARAYSAWELFNHQQAFEYLKMVDSRKFDDNKSFLTALLEADKQEPYYIADILNNAARRGEQENKYDDAVARLYRVIELIAQNRLKLYGVDNTGDVPADKIPEGAKWLIKPGSSKIELGLRHSYSLLNAYGDPLGEMFEKDTELSKLLFARNNSILAHGLKPVSQKTFTSLQQIALRFAEEAVPDFRTLYRRSRFISLNIF